MCPVSEGGIRDGTFWETRPRARVGTGLGSLLASRPWGGMYGGGQSVVQGIPPVGLGLQGLRMSSSSRLSVFTWIWVGPVSHSRLPPGDQPRGLSPGLQQHKAALGCSCCLPSGAQLFPAASAAPPCTTTWAALHPSCWPLRPKRAGKWGRPPQPAPVACPEWRPYSPASQEPTASFELGEGPQVEVMQSQSLNPPGFPTPALHQQEPPSLHILGP